MLSHTNLQRLFRPSLYLLLHLVLLSPSSPILALDSDRQQPVHIESEHATADYKNGYTVYTGNVKLSQGTLIIKADEITIRRSQSGTGVNSVVATGHPAHFQQQPEIEKPPIHARANRITYDVPKELLELQEEVHIELEESTHQGSRYEYNIKTQVLNASGEEGSRVKVTFLPSEEPTTEEASPRLKNKETSPDGDT